MNFATTCEPSYCHYPAAAGRHYFYRLFTIMVLKNGLSYQNASGPFRNGPLEVMDLTMDLVDGPLGDEPGEGLGIDPGEGPGEGLGDGQGKGTGGGSLRKVPGECPEQWTCQMLVATGHHGGSNE